MRFELNENKRNITNDMLIEDLLRVSQELNTLQVTRDMYDSHGKYSACTIGRRFNGWNKALIKAGLFVTHHYTKNNYNHIQASISDILEDIRIVAINLNKETLTSTEYNTYGKHGYRYVTSRFENWDNALKAAGLKETGFHHTISKEQLLEEIERIWIQLGRQPTCTDIKNGLSKYSLNSYTRKFGSWRKALETFVEWVKDEKEEPAENITIPEAKIIPKQQVKAQSEHKTSRDINLRLRFRIMHRDKFKCCICGSSPAKDSSVELHIDHIIPWSKGGETVFDNLQTLCSKCNLGKSDIDM